MNTNSACLLEFDNISITGASAVCNNQIMAYTLDSELNSTSVSWSLSNSNFTIIDGQGTPVVTIQGKSIGTGSSVLTASIPAAACDVIETKELWLGNPTFYGGLTNGDYLAYGTNINPVCEDELIETDLTFPGASSFTWQKTYSSPTNIFWGQIGDNIRFSLPTPGNSATFRLTLNNSCSTVTYDFRFRAITCSGDPCDQFLVSPNPASAVINIIAPPDPCETTLLSAESMVSTSTTDLSLDIRTVTIKTIEGTIVKTYHFGKNKKEVEIDISRLNPGLYILEISDGIIIEAQRLLIE